MKLFKRNNTQKKEDIQKIKEIRDIVDSSSKPMPPPVSKPLPPPPPVHEQAKPQAEGIDMGKLSQNKPAKPAPAPDGAQAVEEASSPPLFIKIDKYKDVVRQIHDLRSTALTLRDALDALFDMEKELKEGLNIAQKTLDRFNATLLSLDSSLVKSKGFSSDAGDDSRELEEYIRNVYKQVERLRNDMKAISSEFG